MVFISKASFCVDGMWFGLSRGWLCYSVFPSNSTFTGVGSLKTFRAQRKRIANKLGNPRILKIHFHTFRHWKASTEYAKTKDILHVMKLLGHKKSKIFSSTLS